MMFLVIRLRLDSVSSIVCLVFLFFQIEFLLTNNIVIFFNYHSMHKLMNLRRLHVWMKYRDTSRNILLCSAIEYNLQLKSFTAELSSHSVVHKFD